MNLEEKLKEVLNGLIPLCGTANIEPRIDDILSICQEAVDEACKKQRKICMKELDKKWKFGVETKWSEIKEAILNAPSPKEKL